MTSSLRRRTALAPAALALLAAACSDAGRSAPSASTAKVPGSTILDCDTTATGEAVGVAVAEYIKRAQPVPQRFLSAVGAGTTPLPETGFRALKDKGPTYLYPPDPKGQETVKAKLADVGPYTSLLVTFGGTQMDASGEAATVRLGGGYVGGQHDGRVAPARAVRLRCVGNTWTVVSAEEERSA
jgi:hypothetical protein